MKISITHQRNPLMGYDIKVTVNAEAGEKIADIRVEINGMRRFDQAFHPEITQWGKEFPREGVYPGDNKVEVTVHDPKGGESIAVESWSS